MAEYIDKTVAVDIMNVKAEMGVCSDYAVCFHAAAKMLEMLPAANVVALPEGKPGDFLLWDTGCGYQKIYAIESVCIYPDAMRYDCGEICPAVNHPCIKKIMNREEAEKYLRGEDNAAD